MYMKYKRPIAMAGLALGFLLFMVALTWDYLTQNHVIHFSEDQFMVLLCGVFMMAAALALLRPHPVRSLSRLVLTIALLTLAAEGALFFGFISFPYYVGSLNSIDSHNVLSSASAEFLRQHYREGDKIIYLDSTMVYQVRPFQVDYHLRQKRTEGQRIPFGKAFDDPYSGVPIVDSTERLAEVLSENRRCWIILDDWVAKTSPDVESFLTGFTPVFEDPFSPHIKLVLVETL
jgi:hypothetical protein